MSEFLSNADLMAKGGDPHAGEATRLYNDLHDILNNKGKQHTFWGFLPSVKNKKIKDYLFDWACRGYALIPVNDPR